MEPVIVGLLVVAAIAIIGGILWFQARNRELPEETSKQRKAPAPGPTGAAPKRTPEPAPEPVPEAVEEEAPEVPVEQADAEPASEPAPEPETASPAAPTSPLRRPPGQDDVQAIRKGLKSTREGFIARLASLFQGKKEIDPALLDEVEEVLLTADLGVKTADKILGRLRERLARNELADEDRVWEAIQEEARGILAGSEGGIDLPSTPTAILVVGVNGVGKTTTIGKLASRLKDGGKDVILAAGDTFRAAAVLQLEVWGRRVGCPVVKGKDRADPGSVIFSAMKKAIEDGADVIIADTAGRLHTKMPLMDELTKVYRSAEKALGRAPDEVLLVLDSTNGQNAIQQAEMFKKALPVSGIVLTKLDGTAKGGVILGIVDEHDVPVRFIGVGERIEDLREFDGPSFVEALLSKPADSSA